MTCRVKICGLTRPQDAEQAIEAGADALGFVLEPSSPRALAPGSYDWVRNLGPYVQTFAVYGPLPANLAPEVSGIQYTDGNPPPHETRQFVRVFRLKAGDELDDTLRRLEGLDWAQIEAHHSSGYGGTGQRVDWDLAAQVVKAAAIPIILAGGLTPDNVADAVRLIRPYAVDVSTGTEEKYGVKDHAKVRDFIQAAKLA